MEVKRLGIVGTGLIGASVGLAAKRAGVGHVAGCDFADENARSWRKSAARSTRRAARPATSAMPTSSSSPPR